MSDTLKFAIDVFAVFNDRLSLSGWVVDSAPMKAEGDELSAFFFAA